MDGMDNITDTDDCDKCYHLVMAGQILESVTGTDNLELGRILKSPTDTDH